MSFSKLDLEKSLLLAVQEAGFVHPTPIQTEAIPLILSGRDLLACAPTGTGKTAAFALPLIQRLETSWTAVREIRVRSLILSPTRELAIQLFQAFSAFATHTELQVNLLHGGVDLEEQIETLRVGTDILVATPGRLLDILNRKALKLDQVEVFVVDEADRMLDLGFAPDIRKLAQLLPTHRQALFFSATMPKEAVRLANSFLRKPVRISTDPRAVAENIEKKLYFVEKSDKASLLAWLLQSMELNRVLVFCRTRRGADLLGERLEKEGLPVAVLHGNKIQRTRENMLRRFKEGSCPILVSTDLAARGIDVEDLPLIINFDLPNEPETFIHRIGRTARAGASGVALSFCDPTEKGYLREILRHLGSEIPVITEHPFHSEQAQNYSGRANPKKHTPNQGKNRKKEQNKWRLAPSEAAKLHAKDEQKPKKNARRNPKRRPSQ